MADKEESKETALADTSSALNSSRAIGGGDGDLKF
jgi:hypothetical protein